MSSGNKIVCFKLFCFKLFQIIQSMYIGTTVIIEHCRINVVKCKFPYTQPTV